MIDLADLLRGVPAEHAVRRRIARMSAAVAALGCGLAALFLYLVGAAAIAVAPVLSLVVALESGPPPRPRRRPAGPPTPFV